MRLAAVAGGLLTVDEACAIYSLSLEEFTGWQRAVDRSGMQDCALRGSSSIASSTNARMVSMMVALVLQDREAA